ncbi:hypothetical protein ES703_54591 [subsurface metagenome]
MYLTLYKSGRGGHKYCLIHDLQRTFFNPFNLTIINGILGQNSKQKEYSFSSQKELNRKVQEIFQKKNREGLL